MKNELDCSTPEGALGPNDTLVYLKLEHTPAWAQQEVHQSQELFTRSVLLYMCRDPHSQVFDTKAGVLKGVCVPQRYAATGAIEISAGGVL